MKTWQRRTIGILTLGGGAVGVSALLAHLLSRSNPVEWLLGSAALAIYIWGIWCGTRLLEAREGAEESAMKYWLVQVPSVMSPLFGWFLAGGFHFTVALQVFPLKLHWNTQLGSAFNYSIFNSSAPWWLGINFAAVAVVYVLYRAATRPLPTQASEPPASDPETSSP